MDSWEKIESQISCSIADYKRSKLQFKNYQIYIFCDYVFFDKKDDGDVLQLGWYYENRENILRYINKKRWSIKSIVDILCGVNEDILGKIVTRVFSSRPIYRFGVVFNHVQCSLESCEICDIVHLGLKKRMAIEKKRCVELLRKKKLTTEESEILKISIDNFEKIENSI